jgi:hypothetical protein
MVMFGSSSEFIFDSGATCSCCSDLNMFKEIHWFDQNGSVQVADGRSIASLRIGSVGPLEGVYYVPDLKKNIISISDFGFERACNFVLRHF